MTEHQETTKPKILIVEDEAIIAIDLKSHLEQLGYTVLAQVNSAEKALELIEQDPPDLILMDIVLKGKMDGIEAADIIRSRWGIPVVFLTAYADQERLERAKLVYPFGYIIKPFQDNDLKVTVEMALYVSKVDKERRKTEKSLLQANERLSLAQSSARAGIWDWNIQTSRLNWSPEFFQLFGLDPEKDSATFDVWRSVLHPKDRLMAEERINEAIRDRKLLFNEYRIITPSGQERWINALGDTQYAANGEAVRMLGICFDITERKRTEEVLRANETFLSLLNDNISDVIFAIKVEPNNQFRFIEVNRRFMEVTGLLKDQIVGKLVQEVIPEPAYALVIRKYQEAIRNRLVVHWEEVSVYPAGTKVGKVTVAPIFDANGSCTQLIGTVHDITEHKQAEEKIKTLLEEKELLLREVHHRIKNNMSIMISLLSLQSKTLEDPKAVSALEDAKSRLKTMGMLYDKLYRTENLREMSIKEYLPALVYEIIDVFPNKGAVKIEIQIDDFILGVRILSSLGIIVSELLTNAMKHAFIDKDDGLITVSATIKDHLATFVIEDNGNGIPESITIETSSGFGLQLVDMLTKQIDGTIRIERGKGTRFVLEFERK